MKIALVFTCMFVYSSHLLAQTYNGLQVKYQICTGCGLAEQNDDLTNTSAYTYGIPTNYSTSDIESDYDMRRAGTGSRWHKGIDYSADGGNNLHKNLQETKQKSGITNT